MDTVKKLSPYRLSSLLRLEKNPNRALQLFQSPSKTSLKPYRYSLLAYDLIICKLGRAKMFDEMEQVLLQMKRETRFSPKEIIFCNVISFYGRSRMSEKALHTFHQIPSFNCQRTVKSLNSLLNALLSCRKLEKIREIYLNMNDYSCPDACTYNILIHACCLNNSLENAWSLFDEMRRKGIRPNIVTFGTLISSLCANSMLDDAFRLKNEMVKVFGVRPNVFVYTSLIKGLCKFKELDLAFKLKDEMLSDKRVGIDSAVYSTLIGALFRAGRKEEVVMILEEMKKNGCHPDTVTYNAIIAGLCSEKNVDSAIKVLKEMVEKGCKPDIVSYNILIAGFCREGRLREASDVFEDMPRRECFPDVVSYRTLFDGLCDGLECKEAALILDEMLFKGYVPRASSVLKFVEGLDGIGDVKLLGSVLNCLAEQNCIDVDTWMVLTSNVCKHYEPWKASELVTTLSMI